MKILMSVLHQLERLANGLAMGVMVAVMLIVVSDVLLRYAFQRPLTWSYDFISLYLMAALFYCVLSVAYHAKSLVNIDMLYERFTPRGKALADLATNLSAIVLFLLISYASAVRAYEEFTYDDVIGGVIPWPTWISAAIVTAGTLLLVLRMAVEILRAAAVLTTPSSSPAVRRDAS